MSVNQGFGELLVGEGVQMQGTINVPGAAVIDGKINGAITADAIHITSNGSIVGTTTANHVRLAGKVSETTVANKTLLIETTGLASGNIAYADLEIRKGGQIEGSIKIINAAAGAQAAPAWNPPNAPAASPAARNVPGK